MKYFFTFSIISSFLLFIPSSCQTEDYPQGKILYQNFCANCHMDDGSGLESLIPPLAGADYLRDYSLKTACIIRYGQTDSIQVNGITYHNPMPGTGRLSAFEITNITNYILQAWGNDFGIVKLSDIREELKNCQIPTTNQVQ